MSEPVEAPVLRVVRGEPTEAELAALVTVLAAAGSAVAAAAAAAAARPRSEWRSRVRGLRTMPATGPGAWRASGLPR